MTLKFVNQPMKIGSLELRNRFVMPPMVTDYGTAEGLMTDRQIAYYAARVEGGVGLIVVEFASVCSGGHGFRHGLYLHDDGFIPPLRKLTDIAHVHGTGILIQLAHAGRQTTSQVTGFQPVAPSPIASAAVGEVPHELTLEEIRIIQRQFSEAARRAYDAGFDGVEIHGAHGYLVHQFLSPASNLRQDEYGRDFDGRLRFLIEILDAVRDAVPYSFVVGCRLNGEDFLEKGLHIQDTERMAVPLVKHGASYLHISCGTYESGHMTIAPMDVAPGFLTPLAEAIKKKVSVPVIAVGRIVDPLLADAIIAEGKADLVSMGRALWADPDLPRKAMEGRLNEIRPCIGCNQGCRKKDGRCCTMNPQTLREKEFAILPATKHKRVVVIGGGPAGLECARVAKMRGHEVSLVEASAELGGNLRLAAMPPCRDEIWKGIQFFKNEIRRLEVPVRLGERATLESIQRDHPDEVVIATGSAPLKPVIPGADKAHVVFAEDVLLGKSLGKRVLIIGGGLVGTEVADFLSAKGKEVSMVEMLADIAQDRDRASTFFLRERLRKHNVEIRLLSSVTGINDNRVIVETEGAEKSIGPFDSVVLAVGYESARDLADALKSTSFPVHLVGDALEPGDALRAIFDGAKIAREI